MSKKKLLEFGLKEADAFQKNFKIIFDRLVRGYKSMMGKDPEGLDLLKVKMEAREKALNTTKVVNQKGLTLDPDKPIVGGTQEGIETIKIKELDDFNLSKDDPMGDLEKIVKGEGDTGLPKNYTRPFGDNIRDAYSKAGRDRKDASDMIEALDSPGAKQSYEIMEEALGVRLYGDETFEELMKIKETGVHPRGEPPIKKADGGRVPASPSQLVSESDMILGYRGPGGYQGGSTNQGPAGGASSGGNYGGNQNTGGSDDRPSMADIAGPVTTSPSVSTPTDLGFIGGTTTFTPDASRGSTGTTVVSAPTPDPSFQGYTPSTFDPGGKNMFQKGIDLVKKTVTNPFVKNLGLGILGGPIGAKFGLTKQIDMLNKARAIKNLYNNFGIIKDITMEDVLEEETGQTTALYKDGGLVTLFTEKR
jgi:hypothetical protein